MKFVKSISLFFIYPMVMLCIGFYGGVRFYDFFYPRGEYQRIYYDPTSKQPGNRNPGQVSEGVYDGEQDPESMAQTDHGKSYLGQVISPPVISEPGYEEVLSKPVTLSVETEYVRQERNLLSGTVEEVSGRIPDKYVGMDREQFLSAMEVCKEFPSLTELEKGFVGLEVLSFSRERVVVQMDYERIPPGQCFYLMVYENEVYVYLEDKSTVYLETGIMLETLPEELQYAIIDSMRIEDEEELYGFLEAYSS